MAVRARREPAGVRSKEGARLLSDLMAVPPELRNEWLRTLDAASFTVVVDTATDQLGTPFGLWQDDLVGFVTIGLAESLWEVQEEIGRSIVEHKRTAVPSCHNAGKTHFAARVVCWWLCVWPPGTATAVTTATRWRQVRNILWPVIGELHARHGLPGKCLQTEWQMGRKIAAWGMSPDDYDQDAFSGIHDPHVLLVVDEAGGIAATLGKSMEAMLSDANARVLLIGNPPFDETGSPWFEEQCQRETVHVIRIPAARTPNFTGEATPLCRVHPDMAPHTIASHLVSREWVAELVADLGPDDPYVVARVDANFPKDLTGKVMPFSWLEQVAKNDDPIPSSWVRLGVDVAADGGDEFAIARADGYRVGIVHTSRGAANANPHDVAGRVLEQIHVAERRAAELEPDERQRRRVRVKIDAIGVGWGIAGILKAWGSEGRHQAEIVPVNVGEACESDRARERFANKRAEMWWNGRLLSAADPQGNRGWTFDGEPVGRGIDQRTVRQLAAPKYGYSSDGRTKIEKKDDLKKRGVPSPDRAEAVLLSVYEPGGTGVTTIGVPTGTLPMPGQQ